MFPIFKKENRPKYWPPLDLCRYGIFSAKPTVKGDLIIHLIDDMMPTDAYLYKVEPALLGNYSHPNLFMTLVEWIRAYPKGFEITIDGVTTFVVYQDKTDPDVVPWVGEFAVRGL